MTTFAELKRKQKENFQKLNNKLSEINTPSFNNKDDERFWQPSVDKMGNGYAIIRFLPTPEVDGNDGMPFITMWDHGFKGPSGKWYIEKSLTTLGQKDPVSEYNSKLWATGEKKNKDIVSGTQDMPGTKRRTFFISNIYVVKDPEHPENEGKVFLYRYGKKIFDKLNDIMNPKYPDEKPINPFDLWEGANLKLKISQVNGYRNYDRSEFAAPEALEDDDTMKKIYSSEYSLMDFLKPENFKTYDELKAKLHDVLDIGVINELPPKTTKATKRVVEDEDIEENEVPFKTNEDDEDDDEEFFKKLVKKKV